MLQTIQWKALEHEHTEKNNDWFWTLGIVAASSAIVAVLFNNILFAVLIIVGAATMGLLAQRPPQERTFTLSERGVTIDNSLYPYQMLVAFNIRNDAEGHVSLIVDAQRFLTPHLIASLDGADVDADQVREYLLEFLPEDGELDEPVLQRIVERFGLL